MLKWQWVQLLLIACSLLIILLIIWLYLHSLLACNFHLIFHAFFTGGWDQAHVNLLLMCIVSQIFLFLLLFIVQKLLFWGLWPKDSYTLSSWWPIRRYIEFQRILLLEIRLFSCITKVFIMRCYWVTNRVQIALMLPSFRFIKFGLRNVSICGATIV